MATPDEVSSPDMRELWKTAKKAASKKADAKKEAAKYKTIDDQFTLDLGPDLQKWPKYYPNLSKMGTAKNKIDLTITKYELILKKAKSEKALHPEVLKILTDALSDIREQLQSRMNFCETMVTSNEDEALKQAISASKKKQLKPVVIFKHPDLSSEIMKMVPKAADFVEITKLEIEVILADDAVLDKVDDADGNMAQKLKDAASFASLKKDIALAYREAAMLLKKNPKAIDGANSAFETSVDIAIRDAAARASTEMNRLVGIKVEYRNYRIKAGVKLAATVAGTIAGAASIASAPFTGPTVIISAIGVLKGAKSIGDQLADLSMTAEEMIRELQKDVRGLQKRYADWKGAAIGTAEVTSTLVNAIAPTIFPTIKRCASHCGTVESKINGMETKAGALSVTLNKTLDAQEKADAAIKQWITTNKSAVTGDVAKSAKKLMTAMKSNREEVTKLIGKISTLNNNVTKARKDNATLKTKIDALSASEPTIFKFAEVFIEIGTTVAFLASANVGWPDAYPIMETSKAITDMIGNVVGSLDGAYSAAMEMKGFVDDLRG